MADPNVGTLQHFRYQHGMQQPLFIQTTTTSRVLEDPTIKTKKKNYKKKNANQIAYAIEDKTSTHLSTYTYLYLRLPMELSYASDKMKSRVSAR